MERVLLTAGVALVLVYLSARVHAVVMYHTGLWSFAALQSSSPAVKDEGAQQPSATVDFSLWSGQRVQAYAQALAAKLGTPLAVLSIPKLGLDVPIFEGTGELTLNRERVESLEPRGLVNKETSVSPRIETVSFVA